MPYQKIIESALSSNIMTMVNIQNFTGCHPHTANGNHRHVPSPVWERGGGEVGQLRPRSLLGCLPHPPNSSPMQSRATEGGIEKGGGRGSCWGPMASYTATRALPPQLPSSTRPSDVRHVLRHLCMFTSELHHPCTASAIPDHVRHRWHQIPRSPPPPETQELFPKFN
jgi:hypothetical protein